MLKIMSRIIWVAVILLIALPGLALAHSGVGTSQNAAAALGVALGGELTALAQNQPPVYALVAVLVALLAGFLLAGLDVLIRSLWRGKTSVRI